jgi:LacI family transcriptional regulator
LKPVTIIDIAKALNLSTSTVSRALKSSYKISEETQQKVKEYAAQHNYRPNLLAQGLKSKGSRSIGVILCNIPNSFFAEVLNGIEFVAGDNNYHVIITQSHESYENEFNNLEQLLWKSVDGLLVSLSCETTEVNHFKNAQSDGTPIVFFDRVTDLIATHTVVSDNLQGTYDATLHLIKNGCLKIAQITSAPNVSISKERLAGYVKALKEYNLPVREEYIQYCDHGGMIGHEVEKAVNGLLALDERPDAIVTASDRITIECFACLKKNGILIPEEIALTGFSNFIAPQLFNPALTTIRQPAFEMGKVATELLLKLIESKRPVKDFEKRVLPTELNIRESTLKVIPV